MYQEQFEEINIKRLRVALKVSEIKSISETPEYFKIRDFGIKTLVEFTPFELDQEDMENFAGELEEKLGIPGLFGEIYDMRNDETLEAQLLFEGN